jgi:hypothetical protein
MQAHAAPGAVRVFRGEPCRIQDARRWAAAVLSRAGADPEAAALLTSELVTNALLHTRSGQPGGTVTVLVTPGGVLHVHDLGPAGPGPCGGPGGWAPGAERADFGRGLLLVAELGTGFAHGPAAACPVAWPGAPAAGAGGCCTRCVPPAPEAAPAGAAPLEGQPSAAAA